jgi:hypothetical protein
MACAIFSTKPITSCWRNSNKSSINTRWQSIKFGRNSIQSPELLFALQTISQKSSHENESSQSGKTFKMILKTQAKSSSKKPLLQSANLSFCQTNFMKTSSKSKY